MQYLRIDSSLLNKKISSTIRDYNYNCFDILKEHLNIQVYKKYLNTLIEYKLKTIWNHIVLKWIKINNQLINDNEFKQSIYSEQTYNHIHERIIEEELNDLLNTFINDDKFKAIFAINCIQDHLIKIK